MLREYDMRHTAMLKELSARLDHLPKSMTEALAQLVSQQRHPQPEHQRR